MESKRQKQVGKQIQKDLGEIFRKDFALSFDGAFVTITDVKVSPDLAIARVYLSFLMAHDKEAVLEIVRKNTKKIRGIFGQKVRKQLRIVPSFQFYIDDTAEYSQHISEVLSKLDIPPAPNDDEDEDIYTR